MFVCLFVCLYSKNAKIKFPEKAVVQNCIVFSDEIYALVFFHEDLAERVVILLNYLHGGIMDLYCVSNGGNNYLQLLYPW